MALLPLQNKKILITRAEKQSIDFINKVLHYGGKPIALPLIAFKEATLTSEEQHILMNASTYDWIIFTSVNGIEYFFKQLKRFNLTTELSNIKIAVVGEKTNETLSRYGYKASVQPEEYVAEGLVECLSQYVLENEKVLYVKGNLSRDVIAKQLRLVGITIAELTTYETYCPTSSESLKELLTKSIDVITFTSPSTVQNFVRLLEGTDWRKWIDAAVVCCIGPITKEAAIKVGINPTIVPVTYTMESLLEDMVDYFKEEVK